MKKMAIYLCILQPDPTAPPEKNLDLFYDLDKHLKDEDRLIVYVRDAETEIMEFLKRRIDENSNLQLVISLFDKNRIAETTSAESEVVFTHIDLIILFIN